MLARELGNEAAPSAKCAFLQPRHPWFYNFLQTFCLNGTDINVLGILLNRCIKITESLRGRHLDFCWRSTLWV